VNAAYLRLDELGGLIGQGERARILREGGLRIANPALAEFFAQSESSVAAAAMAACEFDDARWVALLPRLPVPARGMLRHRRDLPPKAAAHLRNLGVGDLVLSGPVVDQGDTALLLEANMQDGGRYESLEPGPPATTPVFDVSSAQFATAMPANEDDKEPAGETSGIAALVQRIEAFRAIRSAPQGTTDGIEPTLPLGDQASADRDQLSDIAFVTDAGGRIIWAEAGGRVPGGSDRAGPLLAGLSIAATDDHTPLQGNPAMRRAFIRRQPIEAAIAIAGAPPVAGRWRIDAAPHFTDTTSAFAGYRGRLRRLPSNGAASAAPAAASSRMREMLHELRTPANAIQGFAEVIQQQLFGPSPHEYRALAASIAADAARALAGFDELDRLARLDSGALSLESGEADLGKTLVRTLALLGPLLERRGAALTLPETLPALPTGLAQDELAGMCWRVAATLAAALAPGEELALAVANDGWVARATVPLPHALARLEDVFAPTAAPSGSAIAAGTFGSGFTLRLARAEAQAAGGSLTRDGATMTLVVPVLTTSGKVHSRDSSARSTNAA